MPPKRNSLSTAAIERLIEQVTEALAAQDANRNSGNGNGNNNGSHDSGSSGRRTSHTAREYTYKEFLNCQPLNFKGTEGVVGLTQWFEKIESVFHIKNCTVECQVKYATCTLLGSALTWWNSHVKTVGHDVAYGMPWRTLMKMMTEKYYSRSEIKKLEIDWWNLKVKGTDVVEKYVSGLPDNIQGNVMSARLKMMQEAIELVNDLMDKKVHTYAKRQTDNKRRLDNNPGDNHDQQPPFKRRNMARAYTTRHGEKKVVGHLTQDCKSPTAANNQRTLTCFECGNQGHYKSDFPELKNRNRGNQAGSSEARGRVYALGRGETNQDPNNIEDEIEA
ncbi:hypothetical protein Tco_1467937 [Tanacetum coccineum]